MALITTIGAADSDSYVDIDETSEYLEGMYTLGDWETLEDIAIEARLKAAALLMNTLPLRGARACLNQRLEFPRWWRSDVGFPYMEDQYLDYADIAGVGLSPPTIPTEIVQAQMELAFHVVHNGIMKIEPMAFPEREIKSFGLGGSLQIEFNDTTMLKSYAKFSKARMTSLDTAYTLLAKWIRTVSGGVV